MLSKETIKEQLSGSLQVIIATFGVIAVSILSLILVADTISDYMVDLISDHYGPQGMFNLGIPDIFWILLILSALSLIVKIIVSFLMPIVLPFHGFCPKCGVKPLPEESNCSECGSSLYRSKISKFDVKMFLLTTIGFSIFIIIWYFLAIIVGIRLDVDPGI